MCLWRDVDKMICLVGGLHICDVFCFIHYNQATPLSAVTMMQSSSFLRFSSAKCSALVMFVCIGLLVKVLRILLTSW